MHVVVIEGVEEEKEAEEILRPAGERETEMAHANQKTHHIYASQQDPRTPGQQETQRAHKFPYLN